MGRKQRGHDERGRETECLYQVELCGVTNSPSDSMAIPALRSFNALGHAGLQTNQLNVMVLREIANGKPRCVRDLEGRRSQCLQCQTLT